MQYIYLLLFTILCSVLIYLFAWTINKKSRKINFKLAAVYITTVSMIGVFTEVLVGTAYNSITGQPLWEYRVLPIHNAYTSYYSIVIWGMYGFYLYLLHDFFTGRRSKSKHKLRNALYIGVEAIGLEVVINIFYLAIFNQYLFYYFPNDLWHLTSIQAIPFYLLAGLVIGSALRHFKRDPRFFIAMNILLGGTLLLLA